MEIRKLWHQMMTAMASSALTRFLIFLILVGASAAAPASTSRTKGCDEACQKECLDVLNKYRTNHDAPRLQFSQTLADKAQKWADGGKFGYDMDARGKYGQLIEWDVKDELPTFKAVIKHWHDKEKDYDFTKGKSNNGQTLHDFTQVVWKKAHKAGCGRGRMFGSRYYVVWLDADGVISPMLSPEGSKNIGAPKERDLHWFEVTKLTAVGKPLSQNTTNSSEPTNNTSQHHDCCKTSQQKIRTKSSVSPEDEEDINGQENEEQVLNDSNHIKNDMHASLSRVFDEEDKEVANLRDVFGDFGDGSSLRMFNSHLDNGNDMTANVEQNGNEQPEVEQQRDENTLSDSNLRNMYMDEVGDFGAKEMDTKDNEESDNDGRVGTENQEQVPSEPSSSTIDAGSTDVAESTSAAVIHEELNVSDAKVGEQTSKSLENITPKSAFLKYPHHDRLEGNRHKSKQALSSHEQSREMAGLIMGKVSEKDAEENVSDNHISKEYNSNIISDDNLKPDMKIELSKVARLIDTRIKALAKTKETSSRSSHYGLDGKEDGREGDPMNFNTREGPDARTAKVTMMGAPVSFPKKKKAKDDVIDIKKKVQELWKVHLKTKKEKRKESEQFENEVYQDNGEDNDGISANGGSSSKKADKEGSQAVAVEDFNQLHGYQYGFGDGQHQGFNEMNPMNGQAIQPNTGNHGYGFNSESAGNHPAMGADWFGGPMGLPQELDNPLSSAMNMGPGGLYEYRKKFTSEEPEQQPESDRMQNADGLSTSINKDTNSQPVDKQDQTTSDIEHDSESEPALEPIRTPPRPAKSNNNNQATFIPKEHHDVLTLPKELQFHEEQDQETSMAHHLPEMISENPSVSSSSQSTETDTQPGYFNEDFSPHGSVIPFQNDQPSNTASPLSQPSYIYPMQMPSNTQTPLAVPNSQPFQDDVQMQEGGSSQQPSQQHSLPHEEMRQQQSPSSQQTPGQNYRHRLSSSEQQSQEQPFHDASEQQILQGVTLPASVGIVVDNHQNGYTLLSDKEKSTEKKPPSKDSQKGTPQDSSTSGAMVTLNGRPMKGPYKSSGVYMTKGPFVYQTDTTIVLGGPTQTSNSLTSGSKNDPYSMPQNASEQKTPKPNNNTREDNKQGSMTDPYSMPQNVSKQKPPKPNNNIREDNKQGSMTDPYSMPQNVSKQKPPKPNNNIREDNKQDKESPKESNKNPSKAPGNGFDPNLLMRPSLITLLKEAEGANKTSDSKSETEEKSSSAGSENNEKPKGSEEDTNKTEGSKNEKNPEEHEKGQIQSESNPADKQPESSSSKENELSKEQNQPTSSSSDKRPEESAERPKEENGVSQGEENQSGSSSNEKTSGKVKEENASSGKQKASESSVGSKTDEGGPSSKGNHPGNEKPKGEASESMKESKGSLEYENKESNQSERPSSGSDEKEKEDGSLSEKEKEKGGSSEKEKPSSSSVETEKEKSSSEKEKQDNNEHLQPPPQNDEATSMHLQQGIEPVQILSSASPVANPKRIENKVQTSTSLAMSSQNDMISPQNLPSNTNTTAKAESMNNVHEPSTVGQADQVKGMQSKPLVPFQNLLSRINHALGLDSPGSKLKIASIALSNKQNSTSPTTQPFGNGAKGGNTPSFAVDVPESISNNRNVSHENMFKIGQFWLNHPALNGRPLANSGLSQGKQLQDQSGFKSPGNNETHTNPQQHIVNDTRPEKTTQLSHSGLVESGSPTQVHREGVGPVVAHAQPAISHTGLVESGSPTQVHREGVGPVVAHAQPAISHTGLVESGSPTQVHREGVGPVVANAQPAISHSSCADSGERCSLWQQHGYCSNVQYAEFMKQHCKSTCGYCAFPSVELQSEKAKDIGLNRIFPRHECKDSASYEFSCPTWKAQGYCHKKQKEMKLFCRSTCNFCKRKKIKKNNKEQLHHDAPKLNESPPTNSNYSDGTFAHAQTGDAAGKNVANAQTGNVSNPQSNAYAQGGNTYVQTQSSSSQQTAYAVAYPAPSPQQQTYSNAQSGSLPGRQSSASAQSDNLNKTSDSSPKVHKSSAHAQAGSAQLRPSSHEKQGKEGAGAEAQHTTSAANEMSLEERVMHDSPEYQRLDSREQYFVTTSDSEDEHAYDEPMMQFPKENSEAYMNPDRKDESTVMDNSGNLRQDSRNVESFTQEHGAADEINDVEVKEKEDERINSLMDRFDSEDENLKEDSVTTMDKLEKKGAVDNTVSTKGCNKSCQKECMESINSYRRNHGAQPLTLNQDLATRAQDWADMKAYGHSAWARQGLGGELIAVGSFYKTFTAAIKAWHDEEKHIDWTTGETKKGSVIKHFKQLILKEAHFLGCGKAAVSGEPYYIAQMDVAANDDLSNKLESMEKPKSPDLEWYLASSPYWKDLQDRGKIPTKVHRRLV